MTGHLLNSSDVCSQIIADIVVARDFSDNYQYEIFVHTGIWRGYGTSANVGIVIYGDNGHTGNIYLNDSHLRKKFFSRASVNHFTLSLPESLGQLYKIELWHDDTGKNASWFVQNLCIVDSQTSEEWHFLAKRWIALDKEDGELKIELPVTTEKEMKSAKNLTYMRAARSFVDSHLWFSIFTKPPQSRFTRCQRLSCCLSILLAAMVANAMFYQFGEDKGDTFKLGPLEVGWTQVIIGIQSSLVAIPINVLLVLIFRNIKDPRTEGSDYVVSKKNKNRGCLPHFFVYVAWVLCLATAGTSATFTFLYSIQWGKSTSDKWLTSVLVFFFEDIFILQPFKVVLLASLISLIIRKLPEMEKPTGPSLWKRYKASVLSSSTMRIAEMAFKERDYRTKVLRMYSTFKDLALFLLFVILLMIVCYGNRKVARYRVTKGIQDTFDGFEEVSREIQIYERTMILR